MQQNLIYGINPTHQLVTQRVEIPHSVDSEVDARCNLFFIPSRAKVNVEEDPVSRELKNCARRSVN